ncbi:uncharacterized protein K02A2.6-like [Anopheles bellator]|uniref:uncharacterized protein K02A2.6-like n=1 Tax=Anopheles bellator TaxID=139047 RepID=UPI002649E167|nr:uncharacterized protein K02A2.6-like [Anopheles bellator]
MSQPTPELMDALSGLIAQAIKASIGDAFTPAAQGQQGNFNTPRVPAFTMPECHPSDEAPVADYFDRFDCALHLSQVPEELHAMYARVHMGSILNNALKYLVAPSDPAALSYREMRDVLVPHFDKKRSKFVESIRFRAITQRASETIAQFALRLRQGAAHCEYGGFLDRMLVEQFLHGVEARGIRDAIISKAPETFHATVDIAQRIEATQQTSLEVGGEPKLEPTHKLEYERAATSQRGYQQPTTSYRRHQQPTTSHRAADRATTGNRCNGCGGQHPRSQCRFLNAVCRACQVKGHIARVCKSVKPGSTYQIEDDHTDIDGESTPAPFAVSNIRSPHKIILPVNIDGTNIPMEFDTGAPCGIIAERTLRSIKKTYQLLPTNRQFVSYTGHRIHCLGQLPVSVSLGKHAHRLTLYVVSGQVDSLFGREWIRPFASQIDLNTLFASNTTVHTVTSKDLTPPQEHQLTALLESYKDIFSDSPGKLTGPPAKVHLKPDARPIFVKARDVPLALRHQYATEIEKKIESGFYEKVDFSEWASPTHIVIKKNGNIRITGNYKPTINSRMIIDEHPIPRIETIFNRMKGATLFCHLDITDAYTHLPIDEEFRTVLTLNTITHGLVRPTRAVYGAANIPAIWQRRMEIVFQGLNNVVNYFDDIIVFAKTHEELL